MTRLTKKIFKVTLAAKSALRETRKQAEGRVFELVNHKIDEFLELADYDWAPMSRRGVCSPYLNGRWLVSWSGLV